MGRQEKLGTGFGNEENYPDGRFDDVSYFEDLRTFARAKEKHKVHIRREIERRSERLRVRDELGLDSWTDIQVALK
jgi:hypothetical protein